MIATRSLLIVDSDPDVRMTFEFLLGKIGFDVTSAKNGDEALRFCLEERPRVVLSEVMVSGINGYDLCTKLKGDPVTRYSTRYILMTSRSESEVLLKGPQVCADYYIPKPVDPNDVASDLYVLFENDLEIPMEKLASLRVTKRIPTRKESLTPGYSPENKKAVHLNPPSTHSDLDYDSRRAVPATDGAGRAAAVLEPPAISATKRMEEVQALLGSLNGAFRETLTRLNAVIRYIEKVDH